MSGAARPGVTIVVSARERFSAAVATIDALYGATSPPFEVVYVDGGSPASVTRALRARAERHGFTLLRTEQYLSPDDARNLGFARVRTPYVVFLDNDVVVAPGWLDALLGCAEETGAAIVGPVYCIDRPVHTKVHMLGGVAHVEEHGGRRLFIEEHSAMYRSVAQLPPTLSRTPTEQAEFHCMLVRSETMRALGPLDARFCGVPESQIDLCLAARERGERVFVEPAALVTYDRPRRLRAYDVPYFLWRWSRDRCERGLEHFSSRWRLAPDDPYVTRQLHFMASHRHRALRGFPPLVPLWLGLRVLGRPRRFRIAERLVALGASLVREPATPPVSPPV
ncbi:MAG TPA: glycosyltransferase [Candidatus Binatia bacterium]|jgi:GT2 family glycosyltransferase